MLKVAITTARLVTTIAMARADLLRRPRRHNNFEGAQQVPRGPFATALKQGPQVPLQSTPGSQVTARTSIAMVMA